MITGFLALTLALLSCGAEGIDAPPDPPEPVHACTPPAVLAPTFFEALGSDTYEGLRELVRTVLAACTAAGEIVPCSRPDAEPPAAGIIFAGIFVTLGDFAQDPPEVDPDALPGREGYCAEAGALTPSVNRLCVVIRAIEAMIGTRNEDGSVKLVEAIDLLRPLIADLLRYVDGSLLPSEPDRYEDLAVIRRMVRRCDDRDTIDLLLAILDLTLPPNGQIILGDLLELILNEDLKGFLSAVEFDDESGRRGAIALMRLLITQITRDDYHPDEMNEILDELVYPLVRSNYADSGLEEQMRRLFAHLSEALEPDREPEILGPLQRTVICAMASDPNERLLGAAYDLLFKATIVGLDDFIATLIAMLDTDPHGSVGKAVDLLLRTLAGMPDVNDATRNILWVMLEEENARVVLPATIELLETEILSEVVALADQLLGACGGVARAHR